MWGWAMGEPTSGPRQETLRTADVARESGYSVQQVRDLERLGVIPPAARSSNGYRSYAPLHVHALRAYRGIAGAVGPVVARKLLAELRTRTIAEAASAINEVHVRLAHEREEALRAQRALRAIQAEADTPEFEQASEQDSDAMTITELSRALGVRPSTLRFWEQEGLVTPERVTSSRHAATTSPPSGRHASSRPSAVPVTAFRRCARSWVPCVSSTARKRPSVSCAHVSTGSRYGP